MGKSAVIPTWESVQDAIKCCRLKRDWRNMLMLAIGAYTAYRVSDYSTLTWGDIFMQDEIIIRERKTRMVVKKRPRKVYIGPALRKLIDEVAEHMNKERDMSLPLFVRTKNQDEVPRPITPRAINDALKKIAKKYPQARLPYDISTHSLRKCFAIRVWQLEGGDEAAAMKVSRMLNHSNIQMTYTYLGINDTISKRIYHSI